MPLIIDCHAHLEGRMLSVEQLIQKMDGVGIRKAALIARITEEVEPEKSAALLGIQRWMMNSNVLRKAAEMVSYSFYNDKGELRKVWKPFTDQGRGYKKAMLPDNISVAEAVQKYPDRLMGWIFLNPAVTDPVNEIKKWEHLPGMIGIKAHPYWHGYSVYQLKEALGYAQDKGFPLLIHMGFKSQGDFKWLADTFPDLNIVYAHAAMPYFKKAWELIQRRNNLFVDLSSPHLSESFVHKVIHILGAEKCLYGTDSPYGILDKHCNYDYTEIKGWIDRAPISEKQKEAIFAQNFLSLIEKRKS